MSLVGFSKFNGNLPTLVKTDSANQTLVDPHLLIDLFSRPLRFERVVQALTHVGGLSSECQGLPQALVRNLALFDLIILLFRLLKSYLQGKLFVGLSEQRIFSLVRGKHGRLEVALDVMACL